MKKAASSSSSTTKKKSGGSSRTTTTSKSRGTNAAVAANQNLLQRLPTHMIVEIVNRACTRNKPRTLTSNTGSLSQTCKYFRDIFSDEQGARVAKGLIHHQPLKKKFQDYMKNFWDKSHKTIDKVVKEGIMERSELLEDGFDAIEEHVGPLVELLSVVILHGSGRKTDKMLIYVHEIKAPSTIENSVAANSTRRSCKQLTDEMNVITSDLTNNLQKHDPKEMSLYLFAFVSYLGMSGLVMNEAVLDKDDIPYFQALSYQLVEKMYDTETGQLKGDEYRHDVQILSRIFNEKLYPDPQDNITMLMSTLNNLRRGRRGSSKILKYVKKENRIEVAPKKENFQKLVQRFAAITVAK